MDNTLKEREELLDKIMAVVNTHVHNFNFTSVEIGIEKVILEHEIKQLKIKPSSTDE